MAKKAKDTSSIHQWSTVLPHTDRTDRGEIRRCADPTVHPELGYHGCRTLYESIRHGAALNPLGPCLGFRAVSTTGFATPFIYSCYNEIVARIDAFAAGLEALDLVPRNDDHLKLLGLYIPNCMEWIIAEQGLYSVGGATVPFYDTCKLYFVLHSLMRSLRFQAYAS
jgi:long-chain acyl-CoA synthetase